jgi:hypothetical protein
MKVLLSFLLLLGFAFSAAAQIDTNKPARFKTKVVFNDARNNGGEVATSISPSPEGTAPGSEVKDTGTSPGREYELAWKFLGQKGDKDIYRFTFTRMTKAGVLSKTTTSKVVAFNGKRLVVFDEELHEVILESPTESELKKAAR